MKTTRFLGVSVGLALLVTASARAAEISAEPLGESDVVEIPGLGAVDLGQLPPDLRDNIRMPGVVYEEPVEPKYEAPVVEPPPDPLKAALDTAQRFRAQF